MRKPKITVIGGGTGISVILDSLRKKDVDIAAIVTVADDGGSSGELRKNIQQLTPPGDLRNVLVALSDMPRFYEKVFQSLCRRRWRSGRPPTWKFDYCWNFRNAGFYL